MQRSRYRDAIRANYAELLFTCAAFIALGAVCCWYLSGMMRKQMDLYSESVMTVSQAHLQALINADEMALHDSAVTVVEALNYGVPREKLKDVFTELSNNFLEQRNVKELFAAVYGSIDGQFIVGGDWIPPEGYDPAQRPWYVGAVRYKGLAYSSEPYKDLITGEMACSVSKVLFDKDGVDRGVLSVSFLLDPVLKLVQSISFAEEGYGVLFDRSLRVISHPDKSFIGRHMTDIPSYEKIRENLAMNIFGTQLQITDYTGEDCLAFFSRLRNGWYIGLIVPYDRYYSDIYSMIPTISATGLVFMVMLCFILINLSIAKMRSDEENRSKSSFLASMSHEIRTPMNAIIGMADLMRTDNLDETQREYLVDIKKTSGALLNIINDILDFSKIEAGKMALVQTHYNLFTLFDNIRSIAEFFTAEKALRLECDIDETLPRVLYGDEGRVRQIIMNLVSNAVKYTHKGQVSLRLRRTTKNERDYLAVSVEDTGIGIKKEDFPRLFESFEQVDKDKNRGITGTGLGLPITKRLADLMGGEIFFESEYGRGSVFTVLLPLEEGDPFKADILKRRTRCSVSQDARILVVDDNALNLTVAQGFLARHGVRAETAVSGEEAIEKIYTARYDLVFMDHMMPGMDGIETVHRIRALPGAYYADLPIVALSANAVLELRDLFFQAGMNGFIAKPIDADELNAALIRWLPPEKILAEEEEDATAERVDDDDSPAGGEYDEMLLRLRDIDDLDIAAGLARTAGDKRTYTDILRRFCAGLDRDIADIRAFMEKGEWKAYSIRLHSLKSVFANFGSRRMTERAFALENASANGDAATCLQGTPGFCCEMEAFRAKLLAAGLGESEASVPKTRIGDGELALKLKTLERACLDGNADEAGRTADELRRLTRDAATDLLLIKISDLTESFDYDEAAAGCGELIAMLDVAGAGAGAGADEGSGSL